MLYPLSSCQHLPALCFCLSSRRRLCRLLYILYSVAFVACVIESCSYVTFVGTSVISLSGFRDNVVESRFVFLLSDMFLLLRQSLNDCASLYCFQICFHVIPIVTCSAIL